MHHEAAPRLRASGEADLDWLLAAEADDDVRPWIVPWTRERHHAAFDMPGVAHLCAERGDGRRIGFVILAGVEADSSTIEFRRLVVTERGRGHGRALVEAVCVEAFGRRRAHRLWLDVKQNNGRARRLYRGAGFVEEGTMRECLPEKGGYASLVLMSMLEHEYAARTSRR